MAEPQKIVTGQKGYKKNRRSQSSIAPNSGLVQLNCALNEIDTGGDAAFFDSNVIKPIGISGDWYSDYFYNVRNYSGFDTSMILKLADSYSSVLEYIERGDKMTIVAVSDELKQLSFLVGRKMEVLDWDIRHLPHHSGGDYRAKVESISYISETLNMFYDTLCNLHRAIALRIYEPPANSAVGMIEEIVAETDYKLKITYDPVHVEYNDEKRKIEKHTAEKLVAAALYHTLTGENTYLLTANAGAYKLLVATLYALNESGLMPALKSGKSDSLFVTTAKISERNEARYSLWEISLLNPLSSWIIHYDSIDWSHAGSIAKSLSSRLTGSFP